MTIIYRALNLCVLIAEFYLIVAIGYTVVHFYRKFRKDCRYKPGALSEFIPFWNLRGQDKSFYIFFLDVAVVIGLVHMVLSEVVSSNEIGSFYEKANYTEDYAATLYIGDSTIPCIVTISRNTYLEEDRRGHTDVQTSYSLDYIELPYGKSEDLNEAYSIKDNGRASISLGPQGQDAEVSLIAPATEEYYDIVEKTAISSNGDICASRISDIYHHESCQYVKNIDKNNLVRFNSPEEASAFGYEQCDRCWNY